MEGESVREVREGRKCIDLISGEEKEEENPSYFYGERVAAKKKPE